MTVQLSIESELGPAITWTGQMMAQLPFATSQALNRTAFQIQQTLNYETTNYFDQPTPFTRRSFRFTKSTKTNLEVLVGAAPLQGRYLRFGIQGGARPAKGFERKFLSQVVAGGAIPSGAQLVPTRLVPTNSSGNVSLATLKRIQQGLNGPARGGFFYGTPKGGNRPPASTAAPVSSCSPTSSRSTVAPPTALSSPSSSSAPPRRSRSSAATSAAASQRRLGRRGEGITLFSPAKRPWSPLGGF
jgi:hypothetical protein